MTATDTKLTTENATPLAEPSAESPETGKAPSLAQTSGSVLAAFFGVQNSKNRKRDFTHGKASHFIVLGLVFTVLLVGSIALVVKLVLKQAGL